MGCKFESRPVVLSCSKFAEGEIKWKAFDQKQKNKETCSEMIGRMKKAFIWQCQTKQKEAFGIFKNRGK